MCMQTNKASKAKWNYIFIAVTAVIMVWLLCQMQDPEGVWNTLRSANPRYMLAALVCMIAFWEVEGLLLKNVASSFGHKLKHGASLRVSMIGQLFNNLTPFASGGQPMQAYELSYYGVSYGESSCILMVKFIVYQLAITLYALTVTIWQFGFFSVRISGFGLFIATGFLTNIFALGTMLLIGLFPKATRKCLSGLVNLATRIRIIRKPDKWHTRLNTELDMFYTNFQVMRSKPRIVFMPLVLTLLQLTIYYTIPYLLFRALNIDGIDYIQSFCATLFVAMVTSFVPAPGASGGAEGSFYWFLSIFIDNGDLLLMVTVLWRVFTFYLPIAVGGCFYFVQRHLNKHLSAVPAPESENIDSRN